MRALSLWQPWASLVSLGVKTIETRSWSTKYRGPLAIHATARRPDMAMLEDGLAGEIWDEDECLVQWSQTPREDYIPGRAPSVNERWWLSLAPNHAVVDMPLGAVVATCELVGVVPMVAPGSCVGPCLLVIDETASADLLESELWTWQAPHGDKRHPYLPWSDVGDQLPYGDFQPGRFAWLLENIKPIEPISAKGHQGLWTFDALTKAVQ